MLMAFKKIALEAGTCGTIAGNVRALCRCGISIPSARNHCPAFDKDKYYDPMFGVAFQAPTNAAMLLQPIATTSSRTCTKPTVGCSFIISSIFLPYLNLHSFLSL